MRKSTLRSGSIVLAFLLCHAAGAIEQDSRHQLKQSRRGSRGKSTEMKLTALRLALSDYQEKCGSYPTSAQGGLRALFVVPADAHCTDYDPLDQKDNQWLKDAWGNEFVYESKDGKTYKLRSLGRDKKPGGRGEDEDLVSDEGGLKKLSD